MPAGSVSGTWKKANSPYAITGDISIRQEQDADHRARRGRQIRGTFQPDRGVPGDAQAPWGPSRTEIVFTAIDTNEGWFGIRFINSASGRPTEVLHDGICHEASHRRRRL